MASRLFQKCAKKNTRVVYGAIILRAVILHLRTIYEQVCTIQRAPAVCARETSSNYIARANVDAAGAMRPAGPH